MARFTGLTWDHPRGFDALAAAERDIAPAGLIHWEKQPLEGFESHPIGALAAKFDLLVLDHPHIGEAAALDCLQPLDEVFSTGELRQWSSASVGAAMTSYAWQGRPYALPLDIATQVSVARPERIEAAPTNWRGVIQLSEQGRVAVSVAGPHAILNFYSIVLAHGGEPGSDDLVADSDIAEEALRMLRRLYELAPAMSRSLSPIGLLEAMARGADIDYIPLVYGYVTYATAGPGRSALRFGEAPAGPKGRRGSVLGGTGIAVSKRCAVEPPLLDHLRWLMSPAAQSGFIPANAGQPSARPAWRNDAVNTAAGQFYRSTLATTEAAWVRPRFDGYIAFQNAGAALIRDGFAANRTAAAIFSGLRDLWHRARGAARGRLS